MSHSAGHQHQLAIHSTCNWMSFELLQKWRGPRLPPGSAHAANGSRTCPEKGPNRFIVSLVAAVFIAATGGPMPVRANENTAQTSERLAPDDSSLDARKKANGNSLTHCTEPRPQICTREYRPVCAQLQNGRSKTYATACTACADSDVAGYVGGACE